MEAWLHPLVCAALLLGSGALAQDARGSAPTQKEISRELERFLGEHFADQNGLEPAEFRRRRAEREARVLEIVRSGALATVDDWAHAAVILQYSDDVETILLSHALGLRPAIDDASQARTLAAFALDHYLGNLGKTSLFGTQSPSPTPADVLAVDAGGQPLPETIRRLFRQIPLQGREKRKVKKPSSKELAQYLAAPPAAVAQALPRVREIVASGFLDAGKDYAAAARLLLSSTAEEDLLVAHVVALCAAFEEHPDGLALTLESLDRYLLATKRGQLFGTVKSPDGTLLEPRRLAPEVLLRGYGLLDEATDAPR